MMRETVKLGNHSFITKLAGFEHTTHIQHNATHSTNDIPLVIGKNVKNGKIIYEFDWYIPKKTSDALPRSVLNKRCIVIPYVGSKLGELAIFENEFTCHLGSNVAKVELTDDIIELDYLYYYLKSSFGQSQLFKDIQGSAQPNITMSSIRETVVIVFDRVKQQKIANVLAALDAKIELNNRINAELEAMAKTLYDYWFVQFDFPDAEGKPYKASGGAMVWNEALKREIPEGWSVKQLKQIAKTGSGGTPLSSCKEYYENGNIGWINSGELNNGYIVSTTNFITSKGLENSSAKIFPKNTILMAMYGATAGKVSLLLTEASTNQAVCAIVPNQTNILNFLKFGLSDMYQYLINLSTGSARDNLSQDKIKELFLCIPPEFVLNQFEAFTNPIINKISQNIIENQQLSSLRDWLLPMLINGQVVVE